MRALDSTILIALSVLVLDQSKPTKAIMKKCKQFLDYTVLHEDVFFTYQASSMVLVIYSDAE